MYFLIRPCGHRPMVIIERREECVDGSFKAFIECPVCGRRYNLDKYDRNEILTTTEYAMPVEGVEE